jgi:hypothetical protein
LRFRLFVDTIEDRQVYEELKKILINIRAIDDNNPSSEKDSIDFATSRE